MSSNNTSASGGVRNLRAMFETKATDLSTSPPSRGRSPAHSDVSVHSRPVSKVRANFVSVEKGGELTQPPQWALRGANDVSNMAEVKEEVKGMKHGAGENGHLENTGSQLPTTATGTMDAEDGKMRNGHSHFRQISQISLEGGLGSILKGSAFEPSPPSKNAIEGKQLADVLSSSQIQEKKALHKKPNGDSSSTKNGEAMVSKMKAAAESKKPQPPPTTKLITTNTAQHVKPPPTRIAHAKPSTKSPVLPKTPKTPLTPVNPAISKHPSKPIAEPALNSEGVVKSLPVRHPKAHEMKISQPVKKGEKESMTNGIKKDTRTSPKIGSKPLSPVRTARKHESAAAPIAASAAKTETDSSTNGVKAAKPPVDHKVSTLKRPTRVSTATETSKLAKKPSRASLPAQTNGHDRPRSSVNTASRPADESFLARMMRPTTSSAQKAHEKILVNSPPRGNRHTLSSSTKHSTRKSVGNSSTDEDKENKSSVLPPAQTQDASGAVSSEGGNAEAVQATT